jgi:predicted phage-related endonuclease
MRGQATQIAGKAMTEPAPETALSSPTPQSEALSVTEGEEAIGVPAVASSPLLGGKSAEWHANRRLGIGGSDAPKIMAGDWQELWLEKTGRVQPKKIMSDWNRAWRETTETLQLDWWEHKTGDRVIRRKEDVKSSIYSFMRCELDGAIERTGEPINAKHVSGWTKEAREWAVTKYLWQIVHEIVVVMPPSMRGYISIIVGEKEPEPITIDADPVSIDQLIAAEEEFWSLVVSDTPPDKSYTEQRSIIEWETMRTVDMRTSNSWTESAGIWRETIAASRRNDQAAKALRELVDPDVKEAIGRGVRITRSRDGKLLIKETSNV